MIEIASQVIAIVCQSTMERPCLFLLKPSSTQKVGDRNVPFENGRVPVCSYVGIALIVSHWHAGIEGGTIASNFPGSASVHRSAQGLGYSQ